LSLTGIEAVSISICNGSYNIDEYGLRVGDRLKIHTEDLVRAYNDYEKRSSKKEIVDHVRKMFGMENTPLMITSKHPKQKRGFFLPLKE
jgi:hypothetical protein